MFRRVVLLVMLASAAVAASLPTALAEDSILNEATDLRPIDVDVRADVHEGTQATASADGFGRLLDVSFWAQAAETPTAPADDMVTDAAADLVATPVTDAIEPATHLVDAWVVSAVARAAFEPVAAPVAEAPSPGTEPDATAAEPRAASTTVAAMPDVPQEAVLLATAAAASVGWALGVPAALAEKLRNALGLAGGATAGYTRLQKEDVLGHEARDELYERVRDNPGMSVTELADGTDAGRNTIVYHLRVLEREGLVRSERQGRRRVYYSTSGGREARQEALAQAVLGHETTRAIHAHVSGRPGSDQRDLCDAVGVRPSLAHWHVKRLLDAGLLRKERDGRRVRYYPA